MQVRARLLKKAASQIGREAQDEQLAGFVDKFLQKARRVMSYFLLHEILRCEQ